MDVCRVGWSPSSKKINQPQQEEGLDICNGVVICDGDVICKTDVHNEIDICEITVYKEVAICDGDAVYEADVYNKVAVCIYPSVYLYQVSTRISTRVSTELLSTKWLSGFDFVQYKQGIRNCKNEDVMDAEIALCWALNAKNCLETYQGVSSAQLVFGEKRVPGVL